MFKIFIMASLPIVTTLSLLPLEEVIAQTPPAQTYQPGYWQPVARADVNRPITINLINETGLILTYDVTDIKKKPITIEANQTIILNNIQPPLYAFIYADSKNPDNSPISLKYEVHVTQQNIIEVIVKRTEDSAKSNRTFNLQETGGIYLY